MLSCNDICDKLVELLLKAGYKINTETQDHHDIWKALNACTILPSGAENALVQNLQLRATLEDVLDWMENSLKSDERPDLTVWKEALLAEPKFEVQVVVALDGGRIEDIWAYTIDALADAKQQEQDKMRGILRDDKGFVIGESGGDSQVITFVLELDSDFGTLAEIPPDDEPMLVDRHCDQCGHDDTIEAATGTFFGSDADFCTKCGEPWSSGGKPYRKPEEIRELVLPGEDAIQVASCPWCNKEFSLELEPDEAGFIVISDGADPLTHAVYRHECGHLVRILTWEESVEDHSDDICPCGDADCNRPAGHPEP